MLKDLVVGIAFLGTLVGCIGLTMFVLLHTDWWPIFSVLLSLPIGYVLALGIFALFAGRSKDKHSGPGDEP